MSVTVKSIFDVLALVNGYYQSSAPANMTNNDWTGGVYMVGNLAHYEATTANYAPAGTANASLLAYGMRWGYAHNWRLTGYKNCHGTMGCPDNVIAGFSYMALADHTHTADAHVRGMDVRTPGVNLTAVNAAIDVAVSNGACAVATNATLAKMSDYCWWWTDALYMALPTVARAGALAHSQGDTKRATMIWDYARAQYDITAFGTNATGAPAFNLWSPADSLFWRDVSFITKHAPNGRPVFWDRANGWAFAALARTLAALPPDVLPADRTEWEGKMRLMAAKLLALQGADGCWRSQLEDPAQFPQIETSGTALILHGLAYGVNARIFSDATVGAYRDAALAAWRCMARPSPAGAVDYLAGRLGWCQPGGAAPMGNFNSNSTDDYCVGVFLHAGSELTKMVAQTRPGSVHTVAALPVPPPTPAQPVEVFMKGDNVTGDPRFYYCFRIPQLLVLPSGTLLAFAEGRQDGCRPDSRSNRPAVVRASNDEGKTWGPITIAGPALPNAGINYPAGFVRDKTTVVLRYSLSNGSVFSTESKDEGATWGAPYEATQPPGSVKCGSAWPKMLANGDVIMPCGGGITRSSDGGRTWRLSKNEIGMARNVTGLGEQMAVADGRTAESLSMYIRAGSKDGENNHAIATSEDGGQTWGNATLLPIVGATCQGSIGRNASAPPGEVLLAGIEGRNHFRLGRGNMSVWSLQTAPQGAQNMPISRVNVWLQAAGYSDWAQAKSGAMLLLFEGGGSVYDYGIKLSRVNINAP